MTHRPKVSYQEEYEKMKKEYFDASALLQDVFGTDRPVPLLDPQANYVSDKIGELDDELIDAIVAYYNAEEPDSPKPTKEAKYTKEQLLKTLRHHLSEDICLLSMKSHDAIISGYIRQHEEIEKLRAELAEKAKQTEVATNAAIEEQSEDSVVTEQNKSPATKAYDFFMENIMYRWSDFFMRQVKRVVDKAYVEAQAKNMNYLETLELFRQSIETLEKGSDRDRTCRSIERYVKRYKQLSAYQSIDPEWLYCLERTGFYCKDEISKLTGLDSNQYFPRLGARAHIPPYIGEIVTRYLEKGEFTHCFNIGPKRSARICEFIHKIFTDEQISELKYRKYFYDYSKC